MAEGLSGKQKSKKDSADIEKGFRTFKDVRLTTKKESVRDEKGEGWK